MNKFINIYKLLEKKEKIYFVTIILLYFFTIVLELVSLGLIIPLTQIFFEEKKSGSFLISFFSDIFKNFDNTNYIFFAFLALFIAKNLIMIFISSIKNKYLYNIQSSVSKKLFNSYINKPYSFFFTKNTSHISNIVINQAQSFKIALETLISLIVDSSLIIFIGLFLIIFNYKITLSLGFIFLIFFLIFVPVVRKKTTILGNRRIILGERLIKLVNEAFNGIKIVKISNKENFFSNLYFDACDQNWNNERKNAFLLEIPRYLMEMMLVIVFVSLLTLFFSLNFDKNYILTFSAFYIFAIYRILPSLNKLMNTIHNLKYFTPLLAIIDKRLTKKNFLQIQNSLKNKIITNKQTIFNKEINIKKLNYKYNQNQNLIFKNLNLKIKKNTFTGISGPSGCGKTTLVDLISGLINPTHGLIKIDGIDIKKILNRWKYKIGYVAQETFLFDDTVLANIVFNNENTKVSKLHLENLLKKTHLENFINNLKYKLNTNIGQNGILLSGGQKQRIGIARALFSNPELLILDEATSALDSATEKKIIDEVKDLSKFITVIFISHKIESLQKCDSLYEICNQNIKKLK